MEDRKMDKKRRGRPLLLSSYFRLLPSFTEKELKSNFVFLSF